MHAVAINQAEAILEAFWDPTVSQLDEYQIHIPDGSIASVEQAWCAVRVSFEHAAPGACITMRRSCDLDIREYDLLRIFASIPSWIDFEASAVIDGKRYSLIERTPGRDTNDEFEGPISSGRLTELELAYTITESRPGSLLLMWTGLASGKREREMEARPSPYTPDWPGMFLKTETEPVPEIGIFFSSREIEALRQKLSTGPESASFAKLKAGLADAMTWEPESEIGRFIGKPDRRWVRNRDMKKHNTAGVMESLAFVGLIDRDQRYLRMAARMALSAAHCELWSESIIGTMPGTTWHHRSFTEEIYSRACALVLDWAGSIMTPAAKAIISDAIIMKGLPRIESDFKRMEYIRHMNQGIVFSSGRIIGTLALLPSHPRYATLIEEAERDLHEMIDSYVHDDGGTLEGMSYWSYTFSSAMPVVFALSRYREKTLSEYASPTLKATGRYGLGMLSTVGDGTTYLAINDAHRDRRYPPGLAAAYAQLSEDPRWEAIYRASMASGNTKPDIYQLIMAPEMPERGSDDKLTPALGVTQFPDVGQTSCVRALDDDETEVAHFHLCSGPTYGGHFHADKGAFMIEIGGEPLAYDRGVTDYHHPEVNLIGTAARHNLLYPESPDGRLLTQPGNAAGGVLTDSHEFPGGVFAAVSDNTNAWGPGVFTRNVRRIFSPTAGIYLIDDEIELVEQMPMSFRVHTPFHASIESDTGVIRGSIHELHVCPMNWEPDAATAAEDGVDSHLAVARLLRLRSPQQRSHRLLTVLAADSRETAPTITPSSKACSVRSFGHTVDIAVARIDSGLLELKVSMDGSETVYRCEEDRWTMPLDANAT